MCGIVYGKTNNKKMLVNDIILQAYNLQKNRGMQGYGCLFVNRDNKITVRRSQDEKAIFSALVENSAHEILFHHRFPTSTPNFVEATHPILVTHKSFKYAYYVVHNGVITNDEELKTLHEKLGFKYRTEIKKRYVTKKSTYEEVMFNDSEALAIEVALFLEGKQKDIKAKGSIALIVIQVNKKDKTPIATYYGRNGGNPLKVKRTGKTLLISSENDGIDIEENVLYHMKGESLKIDTKIFVDIGVYPKKEPVIYDNTKNSYNKCGFKHSGIRHDDIDDDYMPDYGDYRYTNTMSAEEGNAWDNYASAEEDLSEVEDLLKEAYESKNRKIEKNEDYNDEEIEIELLLEDKRNALVKFQEAEKALGLR